MTMISRRQLGALSLGGLTAALLRAEPARTQSLTRKKRLLTIMTPIGQMPEWLPRQTAQGLLLSKQGASLEPVKEKLLYIANTRSAMTAAGVGDGAHALGFQSPFTGSGYRDGGREIFTLNPSIDQVLAAEFARPPLVLGAGNSGLQATISYLPPEKRGEGAIPVPPQTNALVAYNSLFGDFGKSQEELTRLRALRGSVLDLWSGQLSRALPQVSQEGRIALEAHLTQIREAERRLDLTQTDVPGCEPKAPQGNGDFYGKNAASNFPAIIAQMSELIATAFACDLTDVATLSFDRAESYLRHSWVTDAKKPHHGLTHDAGIQSNMDALDKIYTWQTEQVASLLIRLDSLPDAGGGSVLDNTIVYWSTECGDFTSHGGYNMRSLIAGGGHFRGNYFMNHAERRAQQKSQNDILAEIHYACCGKPTDQFRDERMNTQGERPDLRA